MRSPSLSVLIVGALLLAACSTDDSDSSSEAADTTLAPQPAGGGNDGDNGNGNGNGDDEAPDATAGAGDGESDGDGSADDPSGDVEVPIDPPTAELSELRAGVAQVAAFGLEPGSVVHVLPDDDDAISAFLALASGGESEPPDGHEVDADGNVLVRSLTAGAPQRLVVNGEELSDPFTPLGRDDHPDQAFFQEQRLTAPGFGYLQTRDGTTLSANIALPGPLEDGPYPTVVEYSGYTPSNPDEVGFKDLFTALGYAYVGVNMRGTGCSGGSFRFFEYTQSTDGYDVIEAVAAQPWVQNNQVGMVGVSYPGISQLFVAQTQPPSLAAITPLSVLDDSYRSTLYPGGMLNTGFAVEWTQSRQDDALAAPDGQAWAADRIAAGDEQCAANQQLRSQNPDLVDEIRNNPFFTVDLGDELAPSQFVERIEVPTFIAGAWQDEQTGGRFPHLLDRFTGTDQLYASMTNGLHTDSISPAVFPRFLEFLDLYVAERTPSLATAAAITPLLATGLFGTGEALPFEDRFVGLTHAEALAAFEAEAPIQILFENGAAEGVGALTPGARFVESFDAWPIPDLAARAWFLSTDSELLDAAPDEEGEVTHIADISSTPETYWDGNSSDLWRNDVSWNWVAPSPDHASSFSTAPLTETLTMAGSGSVDLYLDSDADDTDIEVTLTELLPDGSEVYVQSGWLRASHRALDAATTTDVRPAHTHLEGDAAPLNEPGEFDLVRVQLFPFAHVFRAGSQIRLTVDAPGGNRAVWVFETIADGETVTIGTGGITPSAMVLPVIPGIEPPAEAPACGSLRGQPCRPA